MGSVCFNTVTDSPVSRTGSVEGWEGRGREGGEGGREEVESERGGRKWEEGRGEGSEGMGGGREEVERRGWEGGESLHQCSAFHAHYLLEWLGQSLTL